jgi:hypothetical protein
MITLLDHETDIRVLRHHVFVIRMMGMWAQASVGSVVTGCDLMLKRALATVGTYRGCNRCRQNRKQSDEGCCYADHFSIQYKHFVFDRKLHFMNPDIVRHFSESKPFRKP